MIKSLINGMRIQGEKSSSMHDAIIQRIAAIRLWNEATISDTLTWRNNANGQFSMKSAYEIIKKED